MAAEETSSSGIASTGWRNGRAGPAAAGRSSMGLGGTGNSIRTNSASAATRDAGQADDYRAAPVRPRSPSLIRYNRAAQAYRSGQEVLPGPAACRGRPDRRAGRSSPPRAAAKIPTGALTRKGDPPGEVVDEKARRAAGPGAGPQRDSASAAAGSSGARLVSAGRCGTAWRWRPAR